MKLIYKIGLKDFLSSLVSRADNPWWVEIITTNPVCLYYFGPFSNLEEAKIACPGYVEDLETEAAQGIKIEIKRCKPSILTIFNEEKELS
jgi:hypothetical protein